ncbi:MAG: lipid A deacylase LpxR family protein, partial [Gemmatimonadetes bacterium]|nr:lipid A deacylase LpxR family protein [Gemmatimonadota bacterium]
MKPAARRLLLAALLAASPAAAQLRSVAVTSDNDSYDFWIPFATRPDEEYTNGLELRAELAGAPLWGRLFRADSASLSTELRVGQKIFTPRLDSPVLRPGERPYAGWLYLSAAGSAEEPRVRRTAGFEVGVTGPPSQGEWVQTTFHKLAGFRDPVGWGGQLRTEPGVVLRYGEEYVAAELRPAGIRVAEVMPYWGAAAGNVRTGAHAGIRLRAGYAVPRPWGRAAHGVSVYASAGARGEVVLRDLFLDGNTFQDGPRVERIPEQGELEGALGVRLGPFGLE